MNSEKEQALRQTLQAIQKRLGSDAIHTGKSSKQVAYIKTGFADLDTALGGGLPHGGLTELVGQPTSGATSLALKVIAQAQKAGEVVVYLDLNSTFDPDYASRFEIKIAEMLIARPATSSEALEMLFDSVVSGLPGLVILNPALRFSPSERRQLAAVLGRLRPQMTRSHCVLLLLSQPHLTLEDLTQIAAIRLLVERSHWVYEGHDLKGYQMRITILKSQSISTHPLQPIRINHIFDGDET